MSYTRLLAVAALCLGLLTTACGSSPPNRYYVLSAHDFPVATGESPSLGVGPIETPEYLGREKLVFRSAQNQVELAGEALWAEPLKDGVERVLVLNLAGLLQTQYVESFPWHPSRAPDYGVKVNLLQLDADDTRATLTAEWLVYRPASAEAVNRRISRLQQALPSGTSRAEQVAGAYSDLLYLLSETLAEAVRADLDTRGAGTDP